MTSIAGTVTDILGTLGASKDDVAGWADLLGLLGPGFEEQAVESSAGRQVVCTFARTGSTALFQDGILVGILVPIAHTGEIGYPADGGLIDGVDLSATRAAIVAALGAPARTSQRMDLYRLGDRYLRLDFDRDRLTSISGSLQGVAPA